MNAYNATARRVRCGGGKMTEQTKESGYLCDCEYKLPFAVLTVWDCHHCGDLHERVTNCACGKCVYEMKRDVETT